MNITFVSECPIDQKCTFSGIPYYMSRALENAADQYEFIQTPGFHFNAVMENNIEQGRAKFIKIGQFLTDRLRRSHSEVVICLCASMIPFVETNLPIILWHDSTWLGMLNMPYVQFKEKYPLLYEIDQRTLDKCSLVVFPADWQREQTLQCYHVDPRKIVVIPFGANLDTPPGEVDEQIFVNRPQSPYQLTFLGIDWQRKQLNLAFEVASRLRSDGVDCVLNVAGCTVTRPGIKHQLAQRMHLRPQTSHDMFLSQYHKATFVNKIGFLDKEDPAQYHMFQELLHRTHFLIHPASFECFGLVLLEANAYGVPVLSINHFGPKSIIRNGTNGQLFTQAEFVDGSVAYIKNMISDPRAYQRLACTSYQEYRTRLNWTTSVSKLMEVIQESFLVSA